MTGITDETREVHVLLVDDDHGDILLIEEALRTQRPSIRVHTVYDGSTAIEFLHRRPPYQEVARPWLVLLDVHMPRRNGLDVLADIKSDPELTVIPVVMFSASTSPHHISASYELHANAYVVKPAAIDRFFATIDRIVGFYTEVAVPPPSPKPSQAEGGGYGGVSTDGAT